jgi:hypothetical protein
VTKPVDIEVSPRPKWRRPTMGFTLAIDETTMVPCRTGPGFDEPLPSVGSCVEVQGLFRGEFSCDRVSLIS